MLPAAFAYLIFACGFSLVANEQCLAPICAVDKPCVVLLPPCVRLSETNRGWNWVKIVDHEVHGVPRDESKFNLKRLLAQESCQVTITVLSQSEAEHLGNCDYKRSNDSLRVFNEVGKTYPVTNAEDLRQIMNDGIPASPTEAALPTSGEQKFASSTSTPAHEAVVTKLPTAPNGNEQPWNPVPIIDVEIIIDTEEPYEAERRPIVEEIRIGDLFKIDLGKSETTFKVQTTSPNTRVIIDGHFAVGLTIANEKHENYEFNVSSSHGDTFSFKLQPLATSAMPSSNSPANHRLVTESHTQQFDLKRALRHIREVADNEAVEILSSNGTHIVWLSHKYLNQALCTYRHNHREADILIDDGNMITRLETSCPGEEHIKMRIDQDGNVTRSIISRILQTFLVSVLPVVLSVWLLVSCVRSKVVLSKPCGCPKAFGESVRRWFFDLKVRLVSSLIRVRKAI